MAARRRRSCGLAARPRMQFCRPGDRARPAPPEWRWCSARYQAFMFESLTTRLSSVFDRLKRRGALSEADVAEAMREIRIALLEADVALPVVKDLVASVRDRAVGQEVIKSITPGQMVVKIVHDELVAILGSTSSELSLGAPPAVVLMAGLQGSGKTTTSAKLGLRLRKRERKKVLLASLDTQRPAAQMQLEILARQCEVASLPIVAGEQALAITRRALETARREGFDVLILDTAGRLSIDDALMAELAAGPRPRPAARDAAGRRRADRPGRGQHRAHLPRADRHHRHRADPDGRRRPRRCRAQHAPRHRPADQAGRHGREARRAGAVPPRPGGLAHPRHGRRRLAGREGGRAGRQGRGREARQEDGQGQLRPRRPALRSCCRCARWAG